MGLVGNNRYLLQCAGGLWRAPVGAESRATDRFADRYRNFVSVNSRH
jgi:hypothetical protein